METAICSLGRVSSRAIVIASSLHCDLLPLVAFRVVLK